MSRFRDCASIGAPGASRHVRSTSGAATTRARRAAAPAIPVARFCTSILRCGVWSVTAMKSRAVPVGLDEAVPAVGNGEVAIRPGGNLDPMRRTVVLGRVRGGRAGLHWNHRRHWNSRLVQVGDIHARNVVLLAAEKGEVNLPQILETG